MWQRAVNGGGGGTGYSGNFTPTTSAFSEIELGFVPKVVTIWGRYSNENTLVLQLDCLANKIYGWRNYDAQGADYTSVYSSYFYVQGTKVYYKALNANYAYKQWIMAI